MRQRRNAHSRIWIGTSVEFFSRRPTTRIWLCRSPAVGILNDCRNISRFRRRRSLSFRGCLQSYKPDWEHLRMLSEANSGCGIIIALLLLMKTNPVSVRKVALLLATICAVMLASVSQVRADRHPLPPIWCCCPGQRRNSDVAGCRPWRARNGSAFSAETLTDDQRD